MIKDKVKTGVPGLDEMLDGGLIPGRVYAVSGTSGTGKTTLAMQFLLEGVKSGERVLYIALDEPPNEVRLNMKSYGWDVGRVQVFDATPDVMSYDRTPVRDVSTERKVVYFRDLPDTVRLTSEKSPADMTVNTIQELVRQEMKVRKYSRIVVDSLTSLRFFYIRTSEENASLISFLRLLSDIGVTSLLTVHLPEVSRPDVEIHMARGEIRLHKWYDGRGLIRGITVEKYRGSSHDHRLRMIKITSTGVVVKSPPAEKKTRTADDQHGAEDRVPDSEELPPPPDDVVQEPVHQPPPDRQDQIPPAPPGAGQNGTEGGT